MCLVCIEWQKGKMASKEAMRALGEMIVTDEQSKKHYFEVSSKILDTEVPLNKVDPELDTIWQNNKRKSTEDES